MHNREKLPLQEQVTRIENQLKAFQLIANNLLERVGALSTALQELEKRVEALEQRGQ